METFSKFLNLLDESERGRGYLVGGSLRDMILGRAPEDVDLIFPKSMLTQIVENLRASRWGKLILLDEQRLVYRFVPTDASIYFDLSPMGGASIRADLLARDFTINAMAVSLDWMCSLLTGGDTENGWADTVYDTDCGQLMRAIIDPADGWSDLKVKRLHPVSQHIFTEDPLRCIRAGRFYGLGYTPSNELQELMAMGNFFLTGISGHRLYQELNQIWRQTGLVKAAEVWRFFQNKGIVNQLAENEQITDEAGQKTGVKLDLDTYIQPLTILENLLKTSQWKQVYPNTTVREVSACLWSLANFPFEKVALPKDLEEFLGTAHRGFLDCATSLDCDEDGSDETDNKWFITRSWRYGIYARELVATRDREKLPQYALGFLLYLALWGPKLRIIQEFSESWASAYLQEEGELLQALSLRYRQVLDKYSGDQIADLVGREPGPWLSSALSQTHYLALMNREAEIKLILPKFQV